MRGSWPGVVSAGFRCHGLISVAFTQPWPFERYPQTPKLHLGTQKDVCELKMTPGAVPAGFSWPRLVSAGFSQLRPFGCYPQTQKLCLGTESDVWELKVTCGSRPWAVSAGFSWPELVSAGFT